MIHVSRRPEAPPDLSTVIAADVATVHFSGDWTLAEVEAARALVENAWQTLAAASRVHVEMSQVGRLDTAGAMLIVDLGNRLGGRGATVSTEGISGSHTILMDEVEASMRVPSVMPKPAVNPVRAMLIRLGRAAVDGWQDTIRMLDLLGAVGSGLARAIVRPGSLRTTSLVHHLDKAGFQAVPVVALMTFLIGAIIAQQGAFYFRRFGADIFVVDMVGVLVLREIGMLITAILVAGRSGSAFTAEMGAMRMREEVDAMQVIGVNPVDVLVVPRVLALIIALPLLTFIADMCAFAGAALVTVTYGGIPLETFLQRLNEAVVLRTFLVGIVKAPFMALIIALVACVEGFKVQGSTESLGQHTTMSVVKSIFLVIVVDGVFAMFFAAVRI